MSKKLLAIDRASVREIDKNGFMHVAISPLTREQVAPYYGREIPNWEELKLDPDKVYKGYRPAEELQKAETLKSVNGIPIHLRHHIDYADAPAKESRVGSTGTDAEWKSPFLMNSLQIWDKSAQDAIASGALRELSLAYAYEPDFTEGETADGEHYDFVMRNIFANHLALVEAGRAGKDVLVLDHDSFSRDVNMNDEEKIEMKEKVEEQPMPDIEKKEIALGEEIKEKAQELVDIHDVDDEGKVEHEEVEEVEVSKDSIVLEDFLKSKGLSDEDVAKVRELVANEKSFSAEDAKDEEEPIAEAGVGGEADDVTEGASEEALERAEAQAEEEPKDEVEVETDYEEKTDKFAEKDVDDEDDVVGDALKRCGLDGESDEFKSAFAEGMRKGSELFGKKEDKPVAMGLDHDIVRSVERKLSEKMDAINDCKSILGNVKLGAFDSAGDVYMSALSQMGVSIKDVTAKNARACFAAYQQGRGFSAKAMAQDGKIEVNDSPIAKILRKVH